MTRPSGRLAAAAALAVLAGPALGAAPAADAQWYAIVTGEGAQVGYASVEYRDTPQGAQRIEYQETTLREQNARPTRVWERTVAQLDHAGQTRAVETETHVGGRVTRVEARLAPGGVHVVREAPGGRRVMSIPAGPEVRFDNGDGPLASWPAGRVEPMAFEAFNVETLAVERVVLSPMTPDALGRTVLMRARYDGDQLRGVARMVLTPGGDVAEVTQPMYGSSLTIRPTDRATALRSRAPFRMITTLMVKSPFRIPGGATDGHIRYRFGFRDGFRFALPQTGEQRVGLEGGQTVVDICADCGPGLPSDAASLAAARRPTEWLQSDDRRIRALVGPIAALKTSDAHKMEILALKARAVLGEIDFAGHYSASETLDRRRGDCTEAAVLLAAFGRAAGIPTKTASGYVYSRERYHGVSNVFMPHSWTLAYVDGRWRSFDAALSSFDMTHIAVTVGDGDMSTMAASGQLASLLTWDAMNEVRVRPAPAR
ncbi:MAG: transglutaminase-like domain-containing protein [Caulobacteraceae bacterium]|nr:transglutaminase-like domain-containing protein [Caulobacteraceae bacterium]